MSAYHHHHRRGRSDSPRKSLHPQAPPPGHNAEDDSLINTRQLEAFGRTVQATASHLMGPPGGEASEAYRHAISSVHRSLQRPVVQRSVFSLAKANPRELMRANFNTAEIESRAISYVPDDLLRHLPATRSPFSLLDGFKASLPEDGEEAGEGLAEKVGRRRRRKLLEEREKGPSGLRKERDRLNHRLEMMGIRKTMCASEIKEIDDKIANLNVMRKVVLDRLAGLEQEEHDLEQEIGEVADRVDLLQLQEDDRAAAEEAAKNPILSTVGVIPEEVEEENETATATPDFMSESIYQKLPKATASASKRAAKRRKGVSRRISMPVLHEHMEPGSRIRELQAHNDMITALDFDAPFGTMVSAGLDDTVRVWDLNAGRCMGLLEGHLSSVRCLQVEENLVATGSMDASIRLWDLSQADYTPTPANGRVGGHGEGEEAEGATGEDLFGAPEDGVEDRRPAVSSSSPRPNSMADCPLFTLEAHVAEITALHFRGNTLVSGSADKTLRQWDLEKGRCVQTLDVLWAAAQATSTVSTSPTGPTGIGPSGAIGGGSSIGTSSWWRPTSNRLPAAEADFVGALQVFDAALACGTADGMVRLWDLRSGMVHRSLVGHTGPVTALQFDDVFLVTGSQDRSIRIWDLRTGTIHDAFAYDQPISAMQFDARRIVSAVAEPVVKVYDKADGRHWDCGAGVADDPDALDADADYRGPSVVERVRIRDGYLIEGRRDGVVGVWSC